METKTPAKIVIVKQWCGCGGQLLPTGTVYTTYPAIIPHKCDKCGEIENFDKSYPYVDYEEVE